MSTSRDKILTSIRKSIESREVKVDDFKDNNNSVFFPTEMSLLEQFTNEFKKVSGQIIICKNDTEIINAIKELTENRNLKNLFCIDIFITEFLNLAKVSYLSEGDEFDLMEAGITRCEFLIADTGSVMVSSAHQSGRKMNVYPSVHIIYAKVNQIVENLGVGIKEMSQRYGDDLPSAITTITGPSRTADIEKTLVMGAHGPKELILLLNLENN